jgi:hypothetical protein
LYKLLWIIIGKFNLKYDLKLWEFGKTCVEVAVKGLDF